MLRGAGWRPRAARGSASKPPRARRRRAPPCPDPEIGGQPALAAVLERDLALDAHARQAGVEGVDDGGSARR